MMKKILITAAGTGTAFSYVTAIAKNFPELEMITADTNAATYTTSSLFAKKHFQIPALAEESFNEKLEKIIDSEGIDFYLPLLDMEIRNAHDSKYFKNILVANDRNFCKACIEKDKYHIWANKENIKTPLMLNRSQLQNHALIILKKNGGFGSRDTEAVESKDFAQLNLDGYVIYEHIDGEEFTIDCFPLSGKVITTVRRRVEVKNGVSVKAEITKNESLNQMATKIVSLFNLTHPFCFQVIKKEEDYYLIDLNPRLGGGTSMSSTSGCDYFSAHIALILGENPEDYLSENHTHCIVTRQYANYLMQVL